MSFFNSKLRYGLCAAADLARQPAGLACQSREIAVRQAIPGPYLDQILASLKGAGIVRSVRGAGGGYSLARPADKISVGDVARALLRGERLIAGQNEEETLIPYEQGLMWIVLDFEEQIERLVMSKLDSSTLSDLIRRKSDMDDALSIMPSL